MVRLLGTRTYKWVKIGAVSLAVLLGLFLLGMEIVGRVYRKEAAAFIRTQFTRQSDLVLAPFTTTVSVWRHFPRMTFIFHNLSLRDTTGAVSLEVLRVNRAEVAIPVTQFRITQLKISRVLLEGVSFRQHIDSTGYKTGLRFRPSPPPEPGQEKMPFTIPRLVIRNAWIRSENAYKKSAFSLFIKEANLEAGLQEEMLHLRGDVAGKVGQLTNNKMVLFRNDPFSGNLNYNYALALKSGKLDGTTLVLNGDPLRVQGKHTTVKPGAGAVLDLTIRGHQPLLHLITELMPPQAKTFLAKVQTKSRMQFVYRIIGESGPKLRPRNVIRFRINKGEFHLPENKQVIRQVQLEGQMDNGPGHGPETSSVVINNFSARTDVDSFRVALRVQNFLRPAFSFQGKGQINLDFLTGLVNLPFTAVQGGAMVGELNLSGRMPLPNDPVDPDWRGQGTVRIRQATFQPVGLKAICRNVNGELRFQDNLLDLPDLNGTLGGYPFKMQASVRNIFAYLFDQPGLVTARAKIQATHLDTDWLDGDSFGGQPENQPAPISGETAKGQPAGKSNGKIAAAGPQALSGRQQMGLKGITSQVILQVGEVALPLREKIRNLTVQVDQQDSQVKLTRMRFTATGGGVAEADGGFRWSPAGFRAPYLHIRLQYPSLNLQTFMQDLASLQEEKGPAPANGKAATGGSKKMPAFLKNKDYQLTLQVRSRQIRYLYLEGTNLVLHASLDARRAQISRLDLRAGGGQIHVRGEMQLNKPGGFPVKLRTDLHHLDLPRVFAMAEKMKLDVLGSHNVRGTVDGNLMVLLQLDKTFAPSMDKTVAYAKTSFRNLELIGVTPIQNALRMIKKEKTGHLYFADASTNFLLQNNQFLTTGLDLNSNLTAFSLCGTYTMGGGANLNMDVGVFKALFGNNKRRIEKIQSDSAGTRKDENKQHLLITREQNKYKVKLSNKRKREENGLALRAELNQAIRQHQIDTVFRHH